MPSLSAAMNAPIDPRLVRRLNRFASAASVFSVTVGLSGLAGWFFHTPALTTWAGAPVRMVANTAACFVLLGASLWLNLRKEKRPATPARTIAANGAAIAAGLIGLASLAEHVFEVSLGIDQVLAVVPATDYFSGVRPGLMSSLTACDFVILGLALTLLDWKTRRGDWPTQFLCLGAAIPTIFGVLALFLSPGVYPTSMAWPTTATFFVFEAGLLCSRPSWAIGGLLTSRNPGARLLRTSAPTALLVLSLIGWATSKPLIADTRITWIIASILAVSSGIVLAGFIVWVARIIEKSDALNAELEQRVLQRTAALGESEGRLAGVIQSAMDAILSVDEGQKIILFNAAAERMFRCAAAEALGQPVTRFIPQRFRGAHAAHVARFAETGVTGRAMGPTNQLWALRANGQEFQIEASISQVVAGGKKLFTVILRDASDRLQAEAVREHLAAVVDSSDDAIISKDLDGIINAWNSGAEKLFGYSAAEAMGKPMTMLFPRGRVHEEADILARIRSGESVEHFETVRVRKDGRLIDVSVTISPIRDSSGKVIGASKIARDITERKRAEAALRESETNFSAVLNLAPQFVWICTNDGLNTYFNDRWFKYTGLTPEQSHGKGWVTPFHPDDKQKAWDDWNRSTATGEPYIVESRLRASDGSYRWFLVRGEAVRETAGDIMKWFGTCTDIDDMKRAQTALRESEERFQAMANGIPQLAWMAEADGQIFWYNQRWYTYTGTTLEQMQGWGWQSVHDPNVLPAVIEKWKDAIATSKPFEMEFPLRGADGIFRIFLTRIMPFNDCDGRVALWFGTNTDISERKQAQERLEKQAEELSRQAKELIHTQREIRKLNEELEERVAQRTAQLATANEELEAFTYSVSHDLRAPLRHIGGFSKILMEDFAGAMAPEAKDHLVRIEEGVRRMGLLVDELLNLARVGRHAIKPEAADLNLIVEEVVSLLQPEAEGRTIAWNIAKLPSATCDPVLIKQVFQNLIANALKFTRPRERAVIEIGHREEEGQAVYFVRDNGVGFNMKYKDKLFGVFQRLHRAEDFEGTGIGLATVQRILHKHGGWAWAESELGQGTTFFFIVKAVATAAFTPYVAHGSKSNEISKKVAASGAR